jgi:hypothetical protein
VQTLFVAFQPPLFKTAIMNRMLKKTLTSRSAQDDLCRQWGMASVKASTQMNSTEKQVEDCGNAFYTNNGTAFSLSITLYYKYLDG